MSKTKPASMSPASPLSQAQNSVATAHNAVTQAQTHPSSQLIRQADAAVDRAEKAVSQALNSENQDAIQQAAQQLANDENDLSVIEPMKE